MYFVTCEIDCELVKMNECTIVRELKATRVLHTYCCRPPEEGNLLPKRLVINVPHGLFTRKELNKIRGVIRIRTFDGAKDHVQVKHC